jgi:hypothetical protein
MAEDTGGKGAPTAAAPPPVGEGTKRDGEEERGVSTPKSAEKIEEMMKRLEITADEGDAIDLTELVAENRSTMKWAVIIRVCLKTSFSHTAFYQKMQVAWAVAQEVSFRDIDDFTFIAQFRCLGD